MPVENNILSALTALGSLTNDSNTSYTTSHFEIRPDGSMVCCTAPTNNIVTLKADHVLDMSLMHDEDPNAVEMYLKKELARKIADKMIEEDLIKIQYSDDPATLDRTYRATVKFVQE